jgi:hypothetical protein
MWDRDVKGVSSIFKVIRSDSALSRMFPIYDFIVVYYEWMKQESKMRPIYECRCDERLLFKKMDQNLSLL